MSKKLAKTKNTAKKPKMLNEMSFSMKMAKKPKTLGKCLRSLQTKNTAKKPKMFRECLRSWQNRENGQEAQNAYETSVP